MNINALIYQTNIKNMNYYKYYKNKTYFRKYIKLLLFYSINKKYNQIKFIIMKIHMIIILYLFKKKVLKKYMHLKIQKLI